MQNLEHLVLLGQMYYSALLMLNYASGAHSIAPEQTEMQYVLFTIVNRGLILAEFWYRANLLDAV